MPLRVIIIGGGLSGTLLANGLLHHGADRVSVTVYEKDTPENFSSREGYQIRLGAPAVIGMRACLPEPLKDSICARFGRSGGLVSSAPIMYSPSMKVMIDLTKFPAYTKSAPINRVVLRDALAEPLRKAGVMVYGKKYVDYEVLGDDKNGEVRVVFADGTDAVGDVCIIANGAGSPANGHIGLDNIVVNDSTYAWLAKAPLTEETMSQLPVELYKGPVSVIHDSVILFSSAYLPDKVDAKTGERSIDWSDASLMVGFNTLRKRLPADIGDAKIAEVKSRCLEIIKDWDPKIHCIINAVPDQDLYTIKTRYSKPPATNWRETIAKKHPDDRRKGCPRVWFLGDAIHPMLPSRGMGANQAMCDTASCLPALLSLSENPDNEEVRKACAEYEKEMVPRAFGWVKTSGDGNIEGLSFGPLKVFLIGRMLDLAAVYGYVLKFLGWKPKDDVPEFA